jgi:hypothetical protein
MVDMKKYPNICARVSVEERKRFELLLEDLKKDQPYMVMSDLVRILMGIDKNFKLSRNQLDFLVGNLPNIHGKFLPLSKPTKNKSEGSRD